MPSPSGRRTCATPLTRVVLLIDGDKLRSWRRHEVDARSRRTWRCRPISRELGRPAARCSTRRPIHIADVGRCSKTSFRMRRRTRSALGYRGVLSVPLMREDQRHRRDLPLAAWSPAVLRPSRSRWSRRSPTRPRSPSTTFACSTRRKEALEQQTAISEILRVISSSPTDVQPVLDAIAERAARLCDAAAGSIYLTEGNMLRHACVAGADRRSRSTHVDALPINRDSTSGRARARAQDDPGAGHARRGGRVSAQRTRSRGGSVIARCS